MKKLAILGASKDHKNLYLKAKQMGLEVHAMGYSKADNSCKEIADYYHDISIIDKELVLKTCQTIGVDGIVANALEMAVPTIAYVADQMDLPGVPSKCVSLVRNKYNLRKKIAESNIVCQPRFVKLSPPYDDVMIDDMAYPLIVKPVDSSASRGVTKVNVPSEMDMAIVSAQNNTTSDIIIEEFIEGSEVSVESISYKGKHHIIAITDKVTTGAPHFVEVAHFQPSLQPKKIQDKLRLKVQKILNAIGIDNCATHAELKITPNGDIYLVEIGARGGGDHISYDLVELSTGYDYVKGMIEVAIDTFTSPTSLVDSSAGIYYISKDSEIVKDFLMKNIGNADIVEYYIDEKPLKHLTSSHDRTGYFMFSSKSRMLIPGFKYR